MLTLSSVSPRSWMAVFAALLVGMPLRIGRAAAEPTGLDPAVSEALDVLESRYPVLIDTLPRLDAPSGTVRLTPGDTSSPLVLREIETHTRVLIMSEGGSPRVEQAGWANGNRVYRYNFAMGSPGEVDDPEVFACFQSAGLPLNRSGKAPDRVGTDNWAIELTASRRPGEDGRHVVRRVRPTGAWATQDRWTYDKDQFGRLRDCIIRAGVAPELVPARRVWLGLGYAQVEDPKGWPGRQYLLETAGAVAVFGEMLRDERTALVAAWEVIPPAWRGYSKAKKAQKLSLEIGDALTEKHWLLVQQAGRDGSSAVYDYEGHLVYAVLTGSPAFVYARYDSDGNRVAAGPLRTGSTAVAGSTVVRWSAWTYSSQERTRWTAAKAGVWAYRTSDGGVRYQQHSIKERWVASGGPEREATRQAFYKNEGLVDRFTKEQGVSTTKEALQAYSVCTAARSQYGKGCELAVVKSFFGAWCRENWSAAVRAGGRENAEERRASFCEWSAFDASMSGCVPFQLSPTEQVCVDYSSETCEQALRQWCD